MEAESSRIREAKEILKAQKVEDELKLKACQEAFINISQIEAFIRDIQDRLPNLDCEGKRLAVDYLASQLGQRVRI